MDGIETRFCLSLFTPTGYPIEINTERQHHRSLCYLRLIEVKGSQRLLVGLIPGDYHGIRLHVTGIACPESGVQQVIQQDLIQRLIGISTHGTSGFH
jgi:hypothetical protein